MNIDQTLSGPEQMVSFVDTLVVPTADATLLLPVSAVAEVIDYVEPNAHQDSDHPNWLNGYILWREQNVPLVSIEALAGGQAPVLNKQTRFAVLKAFREGVGAGYYALVIQGYPRSSRIMPTSDFRPDSEREERPSGVLMYATLDDQPVTIPDLAYIESQLVAASQH